MVDMGLPEMAYHQAQTLATLQPNNGLAWGVVAYVDARRGQMPEAVSDINLAGQFASSNKFVAHTAGEILAWYDLKADKAKLPDNAKDGLTRIRGLLDKQPAFLEAYDTARKAYQSQTSGAAQPPAPAPSAEPASPTPPGAYAPQAVAPPQAVSPADQGAPVTYVSPPVEPDYNPIYYPTYYDWAPEYCYDWGPGWIAPGPWCWWYPCGFWGGCGFYPFGLTFAFGDFDHFHHGHGYGPHGEFGRGGGFDHHGYLGRSGGFGSHYDPALWHNGSQGTSGFFGTPARPSASLAQGNRQESGAGSTTAGAGTSAQWWNSASRTDTMASRTTSSSGGRAFAESSARAPQGIRGTAPATAARPGTVSGAPAAKAPATHFWGGTAAGNQAAPAARPAYSAPKVPSPGLRGVALCRAGRALVRRLPFRSFLRRTLGQVCADLLGSGAALFWRWLFRWRLPRRRVWWRRLPWRGRFWRRSRRRPSLSAAGHWRFVAESLPSASVAETRWEHFAETPGFEPARTPRRGISTKLDAAPATRAAQR